LGDTLKALDETDGNPDPDQRPAPTYVFPPRPRLDPNAPPLTFDDLDLAPGVLRAIKAMGYTEPTDIQRQVVPLMLDGRDVVGQSQTGTGKTAAFGAPIASMLDPDEPTVQAIVLVPTRELCLQVAGEMTKLGAPRRLKVAAVYGGKAIRIQAEQLEDGAQIVVGTPGRVIDMIGRRHLRLQHVAVAVLDECDEMLDIGFAEDIDRILSYTPTPRQTSLFSATLPPFVLELIDRYLVQPQSVQIHPGQATVPEIEQVYCEVLEQDKIRAIRRLLHEEPHKSRLLVFRRTQRGVDWLVRRLQNYGIGAEGIHGALTQDQRERVMRSFRNGEIRLLVATNVAARGLDIQDISHVVNYDIPMTPDEYVHRIGRTGRAGKLGKAVTFVGEWDMEAFDLIRKRVGSGMQPLDLGLWN
jgi:ATP-dependent RNA helicase DeaD